jgi:LPPG:FO 2-phospho-L-lactate transferase
VVAVLAGGTGGAKLARGLLDVVGPERLTVIANTGDDVEVHGVHVSPDPDLVTWWLGDLIDERGWGIRDDTWQVMDALETAGRPVWFRLGDRDLAMCLIRTELMRGGMRQTEAHAEVVRAAGTPAAVLPMTDQPVRTQVKSGGAWRSFQEFMIVEHGEAEVEGVAYRGIEAARPTREVVEALAGAEAIVIGPSNPITSIGPILAMPGMREAIHRAAAPVIAVSPFVGGLSIKGPTEAFMRRAGLELGAAGAAAAYAGLVDGLVSDESPDLETAPPPRRGDRLALLREDTLMDSAESRERVAARTLEFARSLAPPGLGSPR